MSNDMASIFKYGKQRAQSRSHGFERRSQKNKEENNEIFFARIGGIVERKV